MPISWRRSPGERLGIESKMVGFLTLPKTHIAPDGFEVVAVVARPFGNLRKALKNGKIMQ